MCSDGFQALLQMSLFLEYSFTRNSVAKVAMICDKPISKTATEVVTELMSGSRVSSLIRCLVIAFCSFSQVKCI